MSGYQPGRRAPNVSQYIAGLNQIPQESDFAIEELHNFEDDLALFTNTEFIHNDIIDFDFDFDFNQSIPGEEEYLKEQTVVAPAPTASAPASSIPPAKDSASNQHLPPPVKAIAPKKQKLSPRASKATDSSSTKARLSLQAAVANSDNPLSITIPTSVETAATSSSQPPASTSVGNGDMNFEGDFHFGDIGFTPQGNLAGHNISYGAAATGYDYNIPPESPYGPKHQLSTPLTPVTTPPNGIQGVRPQGVLPDANALIEASSRAAVEEDKRRRNTAASARFRYKKKQREQALEKSAKDMTDKLDKLEEKINQLEKENQWLRGLVVERTAKTSEEMAELYKTFKEEERSQESHKKGVGTLKDE